MKNHIQIYFLFKESIIKINLIPRKLKSILFLILKIQNKFECELLQNQTISYFDFRNKNKVDFDSTKSQNQ